MVKNADTLSTERRLQMYEAREAILTRVASAAVTDLDHFLQATVTEVSKMMGVDRCDIMVFSRGGELRVTHEFRADNGDGQPPSFLETIPVDINRLQDGFDVFKTHVIEDTTAEHLPEVVRSVAEMVGAKSSLLVPMVFQYEPVGIIGLHHFTQNSHWLA